MIEAGQQRRLLAEIARQRHDLDVERLGRQAVRDREACRRGCRRRHRPLRTRARASARKLPRDLDQALVQPRKAGGLVEHRHDDRQAGLRPRGVRAGPSASLARAVAVIAMSFVSLASVLRRSIAQPPAAVAAAIGAIAGMSTARRFPALPDAENVLSGADESPLSTPDRPPATAWQERAVVLKAVSFAPGRRGQHGWSISACSSLGATTDRRICRSSSANIVAVGWSRSPAPT